MPTDVNAESSTAQEPKPLEQFTDAQRSEWLKSGKVPTVKADPPPAQESTDSEVAEDDVVPEPTPEPKLKPKSERRFQELANRNRELEARLAELEKARKPEPPPEKKTESKLEPPKKPVESDFDNWSKYQEARDQYFEDLADYKARKAVQEDRADRDKRTKEDQVSAQNREIEQGWKNRVDEAKKEWPDYENVVFKRGSDGRMVTTVELNQTTDQYLLAKPEGAKLLYFLASNPEIAEKLYALDPFDTVEALTEIRKDFKSGEKRTPPSVTKGTPPARELGGGRTEAEDAVLGAVKDGDFARFQREQNLRDMKRRKGTG